MITAIVDVLIDTIGLLKDSGDCNVFRSALKEVQRTAYKDSAAFLRKAFSYETGRNS